MSVTGIRVFVGSSTEGLLVAEAIARSLRKLCLPQLWTDNPTFAVGETTVESLSRTAQELDIAVMVWTRDDQIKKRSAAGMAPRDNVLLEYGYFSASLGRSRCLIVGEKGVVVPTDVNGITYVPFVRDDAGKLSRGELSRVYARLAFAIQREGHREHRRSQAEFSQGQVLEVDAVTSGILSLGVRGLGAITGIRHSLGMHLWLIAPTADGPRMRRYGRQRLADNASAVNWGDFDHGRGIAGRIWMTGEAVAMVLTAAPYIAIRSESAWRRLDASVTLELTWLELLKTRAQFSALAGVPIMDQRGRVIGALSANCNPAVETPDRLASDEALAWMEEVAASALRAVPRALVDEASRLAQAGPM